MHSIVDSVSSRTRIVAEDVTSGADMICTETGCNVYKTQDLLICSLINYIRKTIARFA